MRCLKRCLNNELIFVKEFYNYLLWKKKQSNYFFLRFGWFGKGFGEGHTLQKCKGLAETIRGPGSRPF